METTPVNITHCVSVASYSPSLYLSRLSAAVVTQSLANRMKEKTEAESTSRTHVRCAPSVLLPGPKPDSQ